MWAYFALRAGWVKINVGTNLGPQIYMYLSALENGTGSTYPTQRIQSVEKIEISWVLPASCTEQLGPALHLTKWIL